MGYRFQLEGFENQDIRFQPAGFISSVKLLVNGEPMAADRKTKQVILTRDDGKSVDAFFRSKDLFGNLHALEIDGQEYLPEGLQPMKWYQYLWCGFPLILLLLGGGLGGLFGGLGMFLNTRIFFNDGLQPVMKYVLTLCVSVGAVVLYFIFAYLFLSLI